MVQRANTTGRCISAGICAIWPGGISSSYLPLGPNTVAAVRTLVRVFVILAVTLGVLLPKMGAVLVEIVPGFDTFVILSLIHISEPTRPY